MPEMCLRNIWMVPKTALLAAGQVSAMSGAQKNSRGFTIGYALMQSTILNSQWGQSPLEFTFATTYVQSEIQKVSYLAPLVVFSASTGGI